MPAGYKKLRTQDREARSFLQNLFKQLQGQSTNIAQQPLFQQGQSYLQNLLSGSRESTQAFEAPYMREFNEQIIPQLASIFGGAGAGSSSGFQQALGQAGASLQEKLAALRSGLQLEGAGQALGYAQQPVSNLMGFGQLGLGTQTFGYTPKQQPFWKQLLLGLNSSGQEAAASLGKLAAL